MSKKRIYGLGLDQVGRLFALGTNCEDSPSEPDGIQNQHADATTSESPPIEQAGTWIGRYQLLKLLGEGGMGVVYLARQIHPIQRHVALKLIKPGMDSKRVIARFEAERQALALLDHPNIAHVLDAGTTENQRPYFVMEYVKGQTLVDHCDRHKLSIDERLCLFLQVCQAVHHAHQKGIIHRDIKPSNILVSGAGDQAIPKIIDFGVAKAINQPLTERTLYTEAGQFIGTPEYMSPEQADVTNEDIDTRSDIYSLGVMLYVLLTGVLPFDSDTLRTGGIEHIRKVIRETDPKTPSTRLGRISDEESVKVAQLRGTDIRTLGRKLHGDLDWITIKAMDKDRTRRYQTANTLVEDIQRYFNNEPVQAGPPGVVYRLRKLLHKNRRQIAAAGTAFVLLVALVLTLVLSKRANERSINAQMSEDQKILAEAQHLRSEGKLQEALTEVEPIITSPHVGTEARLLHAWINADLQHPDDALKMLESLLNERDEIASQAHFLMARIYLEADTGDPDTEFLLEKAQEHQEAGKAVFPESADAYFNRAMMVISIPEKLDLLNRALELDPDHYASLEALTQMQYVLGDYDAMEIDASMMIGKASAHSSGYALRALARRHKAVAQNREKLLKGAISDYSKAIALSPKDPDLYDQRRQTYACMGRFEEALSDAQQCVRLDPNEIKYHLDVCYGLVSMGRFDEAKAKYAAFIEREENPTQLFWDLSRKYVFDVLTAGHELSLPPDSAQTETFLPLLEAREDYEHLEKVAEQVSGITGGYSANWSHDGTKFVYSRGRHGKSGVETFDLESGQTRLLAWPGFDPAWSPDGQTIAFVRARRTIPLREFAGEPGYRYQGRSMDREEVWIMQADGTGQICLAKGARPTWSSDSRRIFYRMRGENCMYTVSVDKPHTINKLFESSDLGPYPVVSPNGKYIAYSNGYSSSVRIVDANDGTTFRNWPVPTPTNGPMFISWSPRGDRLCIAGQKKRRLGTWIYDLKTDSATKVAGVSRYASLSQNNQLLLSLSNPHFSLWIANLDSLKTTQTIEQHREEVMRFVTRRIQVYPKDVSLYQEAEKWRAELQQLQ